MSRLIQCASMALILMGAADKSQAVEGGLGAYLLGSRTSFAGIVPGLGSYLGINW